jgi:alkyl sulfatase BDS1-like metallo-beta-lactamase superfamily hydrolase
MGGLDRVVELAREAAGTGDLRWAAELLDRAIFADPEHEAARLLQADTLERLGFGCENGTWRNAYLAGAAELRHGAFGTPVSVAGDIMLALSPEQVFDAIAIRVDGPRAWDEQLSIGIELTDAGEAYRLELRNGVLVHRRAPVEGADLVLRMPAAALPGILAGRMDGVTVEGDAGVLPRLLGLLDQPDPDFAIVTP